MHYLECYHSGIGVGQICPGWIQGGAKCRSYRYSFLYEILDQTNWSHQHSVLLTTNAFIGILPFFLFYRIELFVNGSHVSDIGPLESLVLILNVSIVVKVCLYYENISALSCPLENIAVVKSGKVGTPYTRLTAPGG